MVIYAVADRHPVYLKAVYPAPVELVNTPDEIPGGARYICWDGCFCAFYMMRRPRMRYPLGRFSTINAAIAAARK